ncbi:MAG: 3-dehydroquinate synthase [Candidatus Omnitrophota bacterium]
MKTIPVRLKERSYSIYVSGRLLERAGSLLKSLSIGKDAVIITNKKISGLFGGSLSRSLEKSGFSVRSFFVPDSETAKSERVARSLFTRISEYNKKRSLFIVALGGGVVGDLAGFVASVYRRGIPYIQAPTTFLAQIDSSIGGKVAIDLPAAKNLIGSFYQPKLVLSDPSLLKFLPKRQFASGLSELIKYGVIKDRRLFGYIERNYLKISRCDKRALEYVIGRAAAIKASVVERDEYDRKDLRVILNYGHTIGHAIEAASKYGRAYTHGEAVAVGMVVANEMAVRLCLLREKEAARIKALLENVGLPTTIGKGLSLDRIISAHYSDKKFVGKTNKFVLPTAIGSVKVLSNVPVSVIRGSLKKRYSS